MLAVIKHVLNERGRIFLNRRDEQREYRRWQILQVALDQFIQKGFHGTSTREIARIAGISSGLMFHYFESKKHLYESLVELGCSKMVLASPQDAGPIEIFEQQARDILQLMTSSRFAARMFVFMGYAVYNATEISREAGELLARHDITSESVPLIERGQELGEIRPGNPLALSIAFWCSLQGIAEAVALDEDSPVPEAEWILDILKEESSDTRG